MVTYIKFFEQKETVMLSPGNSLMDVAKYQHDSDVVNKQTFAASYPGFLVGLAVGVIMVVSELTLKQLHGVSRSMVFHHYLIIAVYISQIVALAMVTHSLQNHVCAKKRLNADETLLLVSYVGIIAWNFLCLIGASSGMSEKRWAGQQNPSIWKNAAVAIFLDNTVDVVQASIQTLVIIRALRFKNELREYTILVSSRSNIYEQMNKLHQELAYLLTTNIAFWVLDAFFEINDSTSYYLVVNEYFQDHWSLFSSLLFPFNVFFRFHSSAIFYEIITRFSHLPKDRVDDDTYMRADTTSYTRKLSMPSAIEEKTFVKRQADIYRTHFATS